MPHSNNTNNSIKESTSRRRNDLEQEFFLSSFLLPPLPVPPPTILDPEQHENVGAKGLSETEMQEQKLHRLFNILQAACVIMNEDNDVNDNDNNIQLDHSKSRHDHESCRD